MMAHFYMFTGKSTRCALIEVCLIIRSIMVTPGRRQSKTPILSRSVDQKSIETVFRLPFVASVATNGNRKHCFNRF